MYLTSFPQQNFLADTIERVVLVKVVAAIATHSHSDGVGMAITSNTTMKTLEPFKVVAFITKCNMGAKIRNGQ